MDILETIVRLSHEFGTPDYVRGGGGNTSCKNTSTLWVKPSGTTLAGMTREAFVAMDRAKMAKLYDAPTPEAPAAREELVKKLMVAAVLPSSSGRPSVEAPLHDVFDAAFVVHTHPALVNGMTCAAEGEATCRRLFPNALWIPYTDPGYSLCMACRRAMNDYAKAHGRQPKTVFIQNHGVFMAADTAEDVRESYHAVMAALQLEYAKAGIAADPAAEPAPPPEARQAVAAQLREVMGKEAAHVFAGGRCPVAEGPVSPDYIVYARAYPLIGEPTREAVEAFRRTRGYFPSVVAYDDMGLFGVGATEKNARLALEFSQDGALVKQLAEAFGGIRYMDERARDFIDNWEVEAYRRQVAAEGGI